jgi:DNA-3-methyladenine glycosylase I
MNRDQSVPRRCRWCGDDQLYIDYHDTEWGVPCYDPRVLFEFLNLEGAQAGLSWITVLKKRDHYREVFDQFDPVKMAGYDDDKIRALLDDPGIIRNRLKVNAFINNARVYLEMESRGEDFSEYLWSFVGGKPVINRWKTLTDLPANTPVSETMCKDLKKRGFKFVGSTICYAFMQACGMVNDHEVDCFRYDSLCER